MITGDRNEPRRNGAKITALLQDEQGHADLLRTCHAGPSGQRMALCVGRIRYQQFGADEFRIIDPETGEAAGYARRSVHAGEWWWSVVDDSEYVGLHWVGYFESLATGLDVLFAGRHAALGRHDSARLSTGRYHLPTPVSA